jgi:hypothetical protein
MIQEQKIITSNSAQGLNGKITEMIKDGWQPIGGHRVVETHHQLRYSGMQHHSTTIDLEYSQTMIKK